MPSFLYAHSMRVGGYQSAIVSVTSIGCPVGDPLDLRRRSMSADSCHIRSTPLVVDGVILSPRLSLHHIMSSFHYIIDIPVYLKDCTGMTSNVTFVRVQNISFGDNLNPVYDTATGCSSVCTFSFNRINEIQQTLSTSLIAGSSGL